DPRQLDVRSSQARAGRQQPHPRHRGVGEGLLGVRLVDRTSYRRGACVRGTPSPTVAFAWGSASTSSVSYPASAMHAATLTAVVVLPTPPFWFAIAYIVPTPCKLAHAPTA